MINQHKFTVNELEITTTDIANYIAGSNGDLPEVFLSSVNAILHKVDKFEIQAGYISYSSTLKADVLSSNDIKFNVGGEVALLLKNCEEIVFFVCTVGSNFDTELKDFTELEDTYVIDIIGTVIVEKSIDKLLHIVQAEATSKGLKTTNTISPGNCGWDISEQKKLFKQLPDKFLGISLNSSGMMNPVKSLSGVIGIGKNVSAKHTECEFCASKNCMYRKAEYSL